MLPVVRIVSLLPSATEICFALGLGDELVGRTHECDYPPEAADIPVMTSDVGAIASADQPPDQRPRRGLRSRRRLDLPPRSLRALAAADPDLILTQELCDVCAVSYRDVAEAVRLAGTDSTDRQPRADEHRGHPQLDLHRGRVCRGRGRGGGPDRAPARAPGAHREPRARAPPGGSAAAPRRRARVARPAVRGRTLGARAGAARGRLGPARQQRPTGRGDDLGERARRGPGDAAAHAVRLRRAAHRRRVA